jgi:hypothetical protein
VVVLSLLSLSIEAALHARSAEQVRVTVHIDGVDVSRADGNDGPDAWNALVPVNRFVATDDFTTATIACCPSCGPACCAIEARVRREGDAVRWELGDRRGWSSAPPRPERQMRMSRSRNRSSSFSFVRSIDLE